MISDVGSIGSDPTQEAYDQYVWSLNQYTVTATVNYSGNSTAFSYSFYSPTPVGSSSGSLNVALSNLEFVSSTITFGDIVDSQGGVSSETSSARLSVDVALPKGSAQNAFSFSIGGFGLFGVVGGVFKFYYVPQTSQWCWGLSGGVGSPGFSVSVGTLTTSPGTDISKVIEGFSITGTFNAPVIAGMVGGQVSYSPGNEPALGFAVGSPGVTLTAGGTTCF